MLSAAKKQGKRLQADDLACCGVMLDVPYDRYPYNEGFWLNGKRAQLGFPL